MGKSPHLATEFALYVGGPLCTRVNYDVVRDEADGTAGLGADLGGLLEGSTFVRFVRAVPSSV